MTDVLSMLSNQSNRLADPDGRLASLPDWSESIAAELAKDNGLELTPLHLDILKSLRRYYSEQPNWHQPRNALKVMEQSCMNASGSGNPRKELYHLFPHGPVREGCKLAGLPIPDNSSNPSFGSVI